jgi:hypothetical protein
MGLHKTKIFCSTKEMVSKLKRTPTEWEKIFVGLLHTCRHVNNTVSKTVGLQVSESSAFLL